jgi:hypothetical protein
MRSPIDRTTVLTQIEIEPGLSVWRDPQSGGVWIPLAAYVRWLNSADRAARPLPDGYQPRLADDSTRSALICPESGCIMARFQVGHGLTFQLDRSPVTGGVWLDAGEWEALKGADLHTALHLVFTAPYQHRLRTQATDTALSNTLWRLIGSKDFEKVSQFRDWLTDHKHAAEIFVYLQDAQEHLVPVHPEKTEENAA